MKRMTLLIASAAAAISFAMPAAAEELATTRMARSVAVNPGASWIALASTPQGRVFKSDIARSEEAARQLARTECENTTARTCGTTISVPPHFDVAVVKCPGAGVYMGASAQGNAIGYAHGKAAADGYYGCSVIAQY